MNLIAAASGFASMALFILAPLRQNRRMSAVRPRVLHVYKDVFPPVQGGVERVINTLADLTRDEFEPAILIAAGPERRGSRGVMLGEVPITRVASLGRALSTPLAPGFVGELRRARADLLHFHFPHPTGEVAYLLSRSRVPAVVTYHSDVVRQKRALALYRPALRRFLDRMTLIMPTSARYMETSEALAPHRAKCRVVPLGLPLADYNPTPRARELAADYRARFGEFVFFIGRLRYYKGLRYLIEAMAMPPVPEAGGARGAAPSGVPANVSLVIAGDGGERAALEEQARAAGLAGRVHFLGDVDHDEAVALFHAAALFCLPACERSEAFGLCQVEALACGLPIVSTDLPTAVPEVNRHGVTGLVVPPRDAPALARALGELLADPARRDLMSAQARARAAAEYAAEKMADRVKAVYHECLGGKP